jgi:hypothetical protein
MAALLNTLKYAMTQGNPDSPKVAPINSLKKLFRFMGSEGWESELINYRFIPRDANGDIVTEYMTIKVTYLYGGEAIVIEPEPDGTYNLAYNMSPTHAFTYTMTYDDGAHTHSYSDRLYPEIGDYISETRPVVKEYTFSVLPYPPPSDEF